MTFYTNMKGNNSSDMIRTYTVFIFKRKALQITALIFVFSLLLCIYYLYQQTYMQKGLNFIQRKKFIHIPPKRLKNVIYSSMTESLDSFLKLTEDSELEVILLEPELHQQISHFNDNIIVYDIIDQQKRIKFCKDCENDTYDILTLFVNSEISLPSTFSSKEPHPSHLFIHNNQKESFLHLVVLYKKGDNYIWSDKVDIQSNSSPHWLNVHALTYGTYAHSFTRSNQIPNFSINKVKTIFGENRRLIHVPENMQKFKRQLVNSRHVDCNYTQADRYYKENNLSNVPTKWDLKVAEILRKTEELLSPLGVRAIMSSGTTLGWYRQCGVITYSNDVDIEILHTEYTDKIKPTLIEGGFMYVEEFGLVNNSLLYKFLWEDIKVDIFLVYENGEEYWYGVFAEMWNVRFRLCKFGRGSHCSLPIDCGRIYRLVIRKSLFTVPKYERCWTDLYNVRFTVPCDTKTYIETTYGKNWFTPKYSWMWTWNPNNAKYISRWKQFKSSKRMIIMDKIV